MGYIYYYNNVREHSSLGYETPFANLKRQMPDLDDSIRAPIPVLLDKVAVQLGPWSGYHVLAQHRGWGGRARGSLQLVQLQHALHERRYEQVFGPR
jgi:hypothetical protein